MRASDVMVSNPIVAVSGARASEVAILFRDRNVSVVPVVDGENCVIGFISHPEQIAGISIIWG